MAYGSNLLTNQSAETQDTTGWVIDPVGSVIVEENVTTETEYIPIVDDRDAILEEELTIELLGLAGDYSFVFTSDGDAKMSQILYASDIGAQPATFQFICKFKIVNNQDLWDNTVGGFAQLKISYDDGTFDYFLIPFVVGVKTTDRYLINFWVLVTNVCTVNADKTLVYAEVSAQTSSFTNVLRIDYIELRKEI